MGGLTRLESSPATAGAGFNLLPWRMPLHDLIALSDTWRRDAPLEERDSNPRSAVRKNAFRSCPFDHPATEVPRLRREGPRVRIRLPPAASHSKPCSQPRRLQ